MSTEISCTICTGRGIFRLARVRGVAATSANGTKQKVSKSWPVKMTTWKKVQALCLLYYAYSSRTMLKRVVVNVPMERRF